MGAFLIDCVVSFGFFVSHGVPFVHDVSCTGHRGALSSGDCAGLRADAGDGQRMGAGLIWDFIISIFFHLALTSNPRYKPSWSASIW